MRRDGLDWGAATDSKSDQLFDIFDNDNSGDIDDEEWGSLTSALKIWVGAYRPWSKLAVYAASGKKQHDRFFAAQHQWDQDELKIKVSWAGAANKKGETTETLKAVHPEPTIPTAKKLFEEMDADKSGFLDKEEVAALYKKARGEKLGKNNLKKAMKEMDSDHSGEVDVEEFEAWWATNGGDLEKHRDRAFTLVCKGGIELLLVAPTSQAKQVWVDGCSELLGSATPIAEEEAPQPEPEP